MIDSTGAYWAPKDLQSAFECSRETRVALFLAGGTDLKPTIHPEYAAIIDLKQIPALHVCGKTGNEKYELGSLTTIRQLETDLEIGALYPALQAAAKVFGSRQIRERATIGGNICNGSPAADMATALLSLSPELVWQSREGAYQQTLEEYYANPAEARPNSRGFILEKLLLSLPAEVSQGCFFKLGNRKALEVSIVSVAISMQHRGDRQPLTGIALGSVGSTPIRARAAEEMLSGAGWPWDKALIQDAAAAAAAASLPRDDAWASAEYRKQIVMSFVRRGLESILEGGCAK